MAYSKKILENEVKKHKLTVMITEDSRDDLNALTRKLRLSQGEVIDLLVRQTSTAYTELANIKYIESREEILKKIITDFHKMKGDIELLKSGE